jgi:hypothetical protein
VKTGCALSSAGGQQFEFVPVDDEFSEDPLVAGVAKDLPWVA